MKIDFIKRTVNIEKIISVENVAKCFKLLD